MKIITHQKKLQLSFEDNDNLIVTIDYDENSKKIIGFCILQTTGKESKQVIKYDTAHGNCHIHKYYTTQKEPEKTHLEINNETIKQITLEIQKKWRYYKQKQKINNMDVI